MEEHFQLALLARSPLIRELFLTILAFVIIIIIFLKTVPKQHNVSFAKQVNFLTALNVLLLAHILTACHVTQLFLIVL